MLAERLDVIRALHAVQQRVAAVIGAVEQSASTVEIEPPRIAAAFAEQLERFRHGMVAPDTLLELDAADIRRHGAPLAAIQPAVRSPRQRVRDAVRVFHAEACEQHFRIAIRPVVPITVRVKQQVGRLQHEHAAMAER